MINISPYLIPGNGSHYKPFVFAVLLFIMVMAIVIFWDSKTLTRYKYASINNNHINKI